MEESQWKAIKPTEVKNAVELFDKDWLPAKKAISMQ